MTSYYPPQGQYAPQGQGYGAPYQGSQGYGAPPYPQQAPQWQGSPPPQQQGYYGQEPQPQQNQWNPEKIWAEANGGSGSNQLSHQNTTASRSEMPFGQQGEPGQPGEGGERGIGATLIGGGAGAFLGHQMGHGKLATIGGLVAGAIAANALEHHEKKKKLEREEHGAYEQGLMNGEHRSRDMGGTSRGIDDYDDSYYDRDSYYEDDGYPRHHHHNYNRDYDDDDDYYQRDDYYRRDDDYDRGYDDDYRRDSYSYRDDYRYRRDDY